MTSTKCQIEPTVLEYWNHFLLMLNSISHLGGGRPDSTRPQIVFFITFVRDATEPQNLVNFLKFDGEYDLEYKNDRFLP